MIKNKTFILRRFLLLLTISFSSFFIYAQTVDDLKVLVVPDHSDWIYKVGEPVVFLVSIVKNDNALLQDVKISYEFGPEKMKPSKDSILIIKDGQFTIDGGTLNNPGFLRCFVSATIEGREYKGMVTVAFDPHAIVATTIMPSDFSIFWEKEIAQASQIPLNPIVSFLSERSTEDVNVYQVSIQVDARGARVFGILSIPKKKGKYPALLRVPGAGVRPYTGDILTAKKGIITLEIGIHGIPVTMEKSIYSDLANGALNGYPFFNLDNREKYYYNRVYLACIRAIDYIFTRPEFDGNSLAVAGGSQGGALAIVTASLDNRVKYLAALYPALSDLTGYLHQRAGGWPHMFQSIDSEKTINNDCIETSSYYDVVNFARLLKVPGYYSWGFNDETCPPTSMYAAYNSIQAQKNLQLKKEIGHVYLPEHWANVNDWLIDKLLQKPEN